MGAYLLPVSVFEGRGVADVDEEDAVLAHDLADRVAPVEVGGDDQGRVLVDAEAKVGAEVAAVRVREESDQSTFAAALTGKYRRVL